MKDTGHCIHSLWHSYPSHYISHDNVCYSLQDGGEEERQDEVVGKKADGADRVGREKTRNYADIEQGGQARAHLAITLSFGSWSRVDCWGHPPA
jgi:hypothetical protein